METDLRQYCYETSLSVLIGENGSGKSQALADLAEVYISKGRNVIAISNCLFDKFRDRGRRYNFIGYRYGQQSIGYALKKVIESIKEPSLARYNVGEVLSYLGYSPEIGICQEDRKAHIEWYDLRSSYSNREGSAERWKLNLSKAELKNWPAIFLSKNDKPVPLELASSGEIQLFTTLAFIASYITKETTILIDEPENSLHPRWQSEYIQRIFDKFYLNNPIVVIATHAPLLVTEAMHIEQCRVYRMSRNDAQPLPFQENGVEQVLWDVFRILTPRSAFLSRHLASLLHRLEINEISLTDFNLEFNDLLVASKSDHRQQDLLYRARSLVANDSRS